MMGFVKKIFGKPKRTTVPKTLKKLNETLKKLEDEQVVLKKKASQEVEKAKEYAVANDQRAAILCLKKKELHEQQIELLDNFQIQICEQVSLLEGGEATAWTVDALKTGVAAMKALNIADVDNIMDKINEQHETMKRMQEAVSDRSGVATVFDEDELEAQLVALVGAELEEQRFLSTTAASAAPVHDIAGLLPAPPAPQGTDKEDELAFAG